MSSSCTGVAIRLRLAGRCAVYTRKSTEEGLEQEFNSLDATRALATNKVRESAKIALTYLDILPGFIRGAIDRAATGDLGIGYEQGAIVSRIYSGDVTIEEFSKDLSVLLDAYDTLRKKIGPKLLDLVSDASEDDFQEAAAVISRRKSQSQYEPPPPGPVPKPPQSKQPSGTGYRRDPRIAGRAISDASYLCEVDGSHLSFISRTTKKNFVEAHHLIPFEFQVKFGASLDVLENVVVLCPTCHRKLHHGLLSDKRPVLKKLCEARIALLQTRGLTISTETLIQFYQIEVNDELNEGLNEKGV